MLVPISFEIHPVADESFSPETIVSRGFPWTFTTLLDRWNWSCSVNGKAALLPLHTAPNCFLA
jgi:hypothetical protein